MVVADSPHAAEDARRADRRRLRARRRGRRRSRPRSPDDAPARARRVEATCLLDVAVRTTTPSSTPSSTTPALVVEADLRLRPPDRAAAGGPRLPGRVGRPRPAARRCTPRRRSRTSSAPTVAGLLGIAEHRLRVVAPGRRRRLRAEVRRRARGGARVRRRARGRGAPVKWVEDRAGEPRRRLPGPRAALPRPRRASTPTAGSSAVDADIVCDVGAYSTHPFTCGVEPLMAATELLGPYAVARYRARARAVATNKAPMAPYRGVSRPQMVLAMERLLQKAALRARPRPRRDPPAQPDPAGRVPVRPAPAGLVYRRAAATTSRSSRARTRSTRRPSRERQRDRPATRAACSASASPCFAERTGYGTEAFAQRKMADHARLRHRARRGWTRRAASPSTVGTSRPRPGPPDHARADRRRPARPRPRPRRGAPGRHRRDARTAGARSRSRSMVVGGGATQRAADRSPTASGGSPRTCSRPRRTTSSCATARRGRARRARARPRVRASSRGSPTSRRTSCPRACAPGLEARHRSTRPARSPTRLPRRDRRDRPRDRRESRIERYVVVEDCGVMINPAIVEGQVRGGVAQGDRGRAVRGARLRRGRPARRPPR